MQECAARTHLDQPMENRLEETDHWPMATNFIISLVYNLYFFATWGCKPLTFQIFTNHLDRIYSLTSGCQIFRELEIVSEQNEGFWFY